MLTSHADGETVSKTAFRPTSRGAFLVSGGVIVRELKAIDDDIDVERHILEYDIRGGVHCADADATRARIDKLLDERLSAVKPAEEVAS